MYTDDRNPVNSVTEKIETHGNVISGSQIATPFWTNTMEFTLAFSNHYTITLLLILETAFLPLDSQTTYYM